MRQPTERSEGLRTSRDKVAHRKVKAEFPSIEELAKLSAAEIEAMDLATLNLACLEGLPGVEKVDRLGCLRKLELITSTVQAQTQANLYRFQQAPQEYDNSEAFFRMLMLVTVLQQDFGVRYNLERVTDVDFRQPSDLFLHGLLGYGKGGTCVSIPTIYTAVAQRLGYPVSMVYAKQHLFCRWDSPEARFNIEGTNQGMNSCSDEHYLTWPAPISAIEVASGQYLKTMSKSECLAAMLAVRGNCLEDNEQKEPARQSYELAMQLAPSQQQYRQFRSALVAGAGSSFLPVPGAPDQTVFLPSGSPLIVPGGSHVITADQIKRTSN